jgi:hypothetical protein
MRSAPIPRPCSLPNRPQRSQAVPPYDSNATCFDGTLWEAIEAEPNISIWRDSLRNVGANLLMQQEGTKAMFVVPDEGLYICRFPGTQLSCHAGGRAQAARTAPRRRCRCRCRLSRAAGAAARSSQCAPPPHVP